MTTGFTDAPPSAPEPSARLRLSVAQRVGLPLMALVPVLALAGAFGERRATIERDAGPLHVAADYPARFRYRQRMTLDIGVANRSGQPLDDVRVQIDSAYLDRFSAVATTPASAPDGSIPLGTLPPMSSARVAITLDGERAGRAPARVIVSDATGDRVSLAFTSFVFP